MRQRVPNGPAAHASSLPQVPRQRAQRTLGRGPPVSMNRVLRGRLSAGTARQGAVKTHHLSRYNELASSIHSHQQQCSLASESSSGSVSSSTSLFAGANKRAVQQLRLQRQQRGRLQTLAAIAPPMPPSPTSQAAMKVVDVSLGDRSYPIYIGPGLLDQGELLRKHIPGKRVLIVTNETIAPLYLDKCIHALTEAGNLQVDTVVLPDGEEHKNMDVLGLVWDKALTCRLDRGATFLALGGGVIGDMTGFAAACYQRGVHFVQVPTTVMAQVDSSVGGKTGVNHPLGKNMIGAFYQPQVVLIDTDTLASLPDRELASGISEIIKYGLIRDAALFEWLEDNVEKLMARDADAVAYAVERSCINKAEVVAADEREGEAGVRATLNLGHTFGHAIETGMGYGTLLHGEAVSIGMVMAADMSVRLGWIDPSILERTRTLLQRCNLPVTVPEAMTVETFKSLMAVDKKVLAGKLRLVLLQGPLGGCVVTGDFDAAKLDDTLHAFCSQ